MNDTKYRQPLPHTRAKVAEYFASGVIEGIGPELAEKIIQAFGDMALEVIAQAPTFLSQVEGINTKKIEQIRGSMSRLCPFCKKRPMCRSIRPSKTCGRKECKMANQQEYQSKPEVKAKRRVHQSKPEAKAKRRVHQSKPEAKAKQRVYQSKYEAKPEVKAKRNAKRNARNRAQRAIERTWKFLFNLERRRQDDCNNDRDDAK